jgi:2-polyprenyl-3-methyl-5-hydroxy-6-metoxy-1,4-benzoquinol methylase
MAESTDYFSNHRLKLRFPWSLYHGPIVAGLAETVRNSPGPEILNIGSGPFYELDRIDATGRRFTICDIDERSVELAKSLHGSKLVRADVIAADTPLPYADGTFDGVVSMDVIEHVPDPGVWLRDAVRVLRPGGQLWLTTPNYASTSLKVIEGSVLEAIARVQGFSRKHLHPSKMTPHRLRELLASSGTTDAKILPISFGWVLAARARKSTPV